MPGPGRSTQRTPFVIRESETHNNRLPGLHGSTDLRPADVSKADLEPSEHLKRARFTLNAPGKVEEPVLRPALCIGTQEIGGSIGLFSNSELGVKRNLTMVGRHLIDHVLPALDPQVHGLFYSGPGQVVLETYARQIGTDDSQPQNVFFHCILPT